MEIEFEENEQKQGEQFEVSFGVHQKNARKRHTGKLQKESTILTAHRDRLDGPCERKTGIDNDVQMIEQWSNGTEVVRGEELWEKSQWFSLLDIK